MQVSQIFPNKSRTCIHSNEKISLSFCFGILYSKTETCWLQHNMDNITVFIMHVLGLSKRSSRVIKKKYRVSPHRLIRLMVKQEWFWL